MNLSKMSVGSMLEGPALLGRAVPGEKVCLLAVEVSEGPVVKFRASIFGVTLGLVTAREANGSIVWEWLK